VLLTSLTGTVAMLIIADAQSCFVFEQAVVEIADLCAWGDCDGGYSWGACCLGGFQLEVLGIAVRAGTVSALHHQQGSLSPADSPPLPPLTTPEQSDPSLRFMGTTETLLLSL
jgi:hypothetical protein